MSLSNILRGSGEVPQTESGQEIVPGTVILRRDINHFHGVFGGEKERYEDKQKKRVCGT